MRDSNSESVWTKKADHLIENDNASWSTMGQSWLTRIVAGFKTGRKSGQYDVVISFAGEDRSYAADLATRLQAAGLSVFYDDFERAALLGQNLYEYLSDVYQNKGRYSVVLYRSTTLGRGGRSSNGEPSKRVAFENRVRTACRSELMTRSCPAYSLQ